MELLVDGVGDVVLTGSIHSQDTFHIIVLMRNGHPYTYIDIERDSDIQNLLDSFHIDTARYL